MTPGDEVTAAMAVDLLRAGRAVVVRAGGRSMGPALADGEVVRVEPGPVGIGDVAVVVDGDGHLRAHRVVRREAWGWVTAGDAVGWPEGPWPSEAVLGRVVARRVGDAWEPLEAPPGGVAAGPAAGRRAVRDALVPLGCLAVGCVAGRGDAAASLAWASLCGLVASVAWSRARRRDVALAAAALIPAGWTAGLGWPLTLGVLAAAREVDRRGLLAAALLLGALAVAAPPLPAAVLGVAARACAAVLLAEALARWGRRRRGTVPIRRLAAAGAVLAVLELIAN